MADSSVRGKGVTMGSGRNNGEVTETEADKYLCEQLLDPNNSISHRFRALFSLRNLNTSLARHALIASIRDPSNLLAHEAAFALGQMQHPDALPALESALRDSSLHPIIRHEAAEALGAIASDSSVPLLTDSAVHDSAIEVRETCELALCRIQEMKKKQEEMENKRKSNFNGYVSVEAPFLSVDPAMAAPTSSVEKLRDVLLDEGESLYERYASLFALRDFGGDDAVASVVQSLTAKSALLRHEVAYVLGQMQNKAASTALAQVLRNTGEHPMVRHEAAEALGSIADYQSIELLKEFVGDPEPIVSQSCEVALTMVEFERSDRCFEYLFMKDPLINL